MNVTIVEGIIQTFGKSLVGAESTNVILEIIAILVTGILAGFIYKEVRLQARHIDDQAKAISAQICLSFFDRLREQDFRTLSQRIRLNEKFNLEEEHEDWVLLGMYYNHFEHIAIVENRGVIDLENTMSFFSGYMTRIKKHKQIMEHINNHTGKNLNYFKLLLRKHDDYIKNLS